MSSKQKSSQQKSNQPPKPLLEVETIDPDNPPLPIRLPKKSQLGKIYKSSRMARRLLLIGALLLAITTGLTAQVIVSTRTQTQSQASASQPIVQYLVLVDADTGDDFLILDRPKVSINRNQLPERINLRPELSSVASQVLYQLGSGTELVVSQPPYHLGAAGWQPIPGTETISVSAFGTGAAASWQSDVYTVELEILE